MVLRKERCPLHPTAAYLPLQRQPALASRPRPHRQ